MKLKKKPYHHPWRKFGAAGVIAGLILGFLYTGKPGKRSESNEGMMFSAMSTVVSVQLYHPDAEYDFEPVFAAVQEEFTRAAAVCNFFDPESELSQLNRSAAAGAFHCSDDLWELLIASRSYYEKTDGAFDVTVSPLLALWGFYKKQDAVPSAEEIQSALEKVGMDKIEFDNAAHTVHFTVPGMAVNLGGIAKGWTLDRTKRMLETRFGIRKGFLNAGGNVLTFGGEFTAGIRDPFHAGQICGKVKLSGTKAIATSGAYERFIIIGGKEYGHIMDARSGYPADRFFSATVIADSGLESDALSTSFYLCGMELLKNFPEVEVLLIGRQKSHPELLEVHRSGDGWEVALPETVPQKNR